MPPDPPPLVLHAYEVVLQARPTSAREGRVSSLAEVGRACETTYEVMQAYWHAHIHVTPVLKILATGLFSLPSAILFLCTHFRTVALCVFNIRFSLVLIIKLVSLLDYQCHRIE